MVASKSFAANDEMQAFHLRREEHDGLSGRVAAADKRHLLAFAKLRLDRRGPIGDARAFEHRQVGDRWPPVRGAGGNDHGLGAHRAAIGELELERVAVASVAVAAIEMGDLQRDGDLHAEFQRLIEGPAGERHAGDAGGEAEIILDARRRAGLSAKGAGIEHDHRQTLRPGVDRRREPGGPRADDRHVIDQVGIEIGRDAEAGSGLCVGRPPQHCPVGTEHQAAGPRVARRGARPSRDLPRRWQRRAQ